MVVPAGVVLNFSIDHVTQVDSVIKNSTVLDQAVPHNKVSGRVLYVDTVSSRSINRPTFDDVGVALCPGAATVDAVRRGERAVPIDEDWTMRGQGPSLSLDGSDTNRQ